MNKYYKGKTFTFQYPSLLLGSCSHDGTVFSVNPNATYHVSVHDPNYYLMTVRELVFPRILRVYGTKQQVKFSV